MLDSPDGESRDAIFEFRMRVKRGIPKVVIVLLVVLGGCFLLVMMSALVNPSREVNSGKVRHSTPGDAREGRTVTFRGVVGDSDTATFSGLPYFRVTSGGQTVKCYYSSGGPPIKGHFVTVSGKVTMWVDGGGGNLRPCAVVE